MVLRKTASGRSILSRRHGSLTRWCSAGCRAYPDAARAPQQRMALSQNPAGLLAAAGASGESRRESACSAEVVARLFRGEGLVANCEENPASEDAGYS